jgi:RNA polymerase sigma-70 factor (ECF subfamily)
MDGIMLKDPNRIGSSKEDVTASLLEILPDMRAFARSLTREKTHADDVVQDATVRALTSAHLYSPGTNFKAWMFTIIRHCFYNDMRTSQRFTALPENLSEKGGAGDQEVNLELCDFRRAFWELSPEHREILTLIGPSDLSYDEAAIVCDCAVGTVKSRVSRARAELRRIMDHGDLHVGRNEADPISTEAPGAFLDAPEWLTDVPGRRIDQSSR